MLESIETESGMDTKWVEALQICPVEMVSTSNDWFLFKPQY